MKGLSIFLALLAMSLTAVAQQTITLPPLTITGSALSGSVTYDPARAVYRYSYTINAAAANKADIDCFSVEILGRTDHLPTDPALAENIVRGSLQVQPAKMLPVGVTVPDLLDTMVLFGKKGTLSVCAKSGTWDVKPGTALGGFVVESKFPPALRRSSLDPSHLSWMEIENNAGDDDEFEVQDADYSIAGTVAAPSEPQETDFFSGGGQNPAEVNKFLRYLLPTDSRIKVPAGTTSYDVVVYYGATINPSTFSATLAGQPATAMFHPIPGSAEIVTIPLGSGTTKLQLEVTGTKTSGQTARDSDTFTFIPQ